MPDAKQAHLQTAKCHPANQSLQKSLLCQPAKKNKKSSLSLKNKTLQTHNQPDNNGMTEQTVNIKGMSFEKKEGQLVTRYIKNWAISAKFQVCSSHLTLCGLTVNRSVLPNFSYTHPLYTRPI
jgi:hypothetical protein